MASSTSSSSANARLGTRPWRRIFLAGGLGCLLLLGGWEAALRAGGFAPAVSDDYALWSTKSFGLLDGPERGVALVGASRIMQAVDPRVLGRELGGRPVFQLGSAGASPLPVLELLAEETDFRGLVVADVTPRIFFADDPGTEVYIDEWLDQFREARLRRDTLSSPWVDRVERALILPLQEHFAAANAAASPFALARHALKRTWPEHQFWHITRDRLQVMDYTGVDTAAFRESRRVLTAAARPLSAEQRAGRVARAAALAAVIEARGGRVVFVNLPAKPPVLDEELRRFPPGECWDLLERALPGRTIHCERVPELAEFPSTDGDHIDSPFAAEFTRRLAARLRN